jgi:hypothetical protein
MHRGALCAVVCTVPQVVALVRRCLAEHADESVRSLAQHMLQHWRWQLAGHLQVRRPARAERATL